jgi:hypothetical protein
MPNKREPANFKRIQNKDTTNARRKYRQNTDAFHQQMHLKIDELRAQGIRSNTAIARELNDQNIPTRGYRQWDATKIRNLLTYINKMDQPYPDAKQDDIE